MPCGSHGFHFVLFCSILLNVFSEACTVQFIQGLSTTVLTYPDYCCVSFFLTLPAWVLMAFKFAKPGTKEGEAEDIGRGQIAEVLGGLGGPW